MKKKAYTLATLGLAVVLGATLFITSEHVQQEERRLAQIQAQMTMERDNLTVLRAEWTYLNRPERLEHLAETYLRLSPPPVQNMTTSLASLPAARAITPSTEIVALPVKFTPPSVITALKPVHKATVVKSPARTADQGTFYQMINKTSKTQVSDD